MGNNAEEAMVTKSEFIDHFEVQISQVIDMSSSVLFRFTQLSLEPPFVARHSSDSNSIEHAVSYILGNLILHPLLSNHIRSI